MCNAHTRRTTALTHVLWPNRPRPVARSTADRGVDRRPDRRLRTRTPRPYQLTANAATEPKYFLRVDNDTLRLLDAERREIASQGNYTLTLTTTLPSLEAR